MKTFAIGFTFALAASTFAAAQDKGGLVPWERDPHAALERAKRDGVGLMLYFTSEG